jgi:hypothetical protein
VYHIQGEQAFFVPEDGIFSITPNQILLCLIKPSDRRFQYVQQFPKVKTFAAPSPRSSQNIQTDLTRIWQLNAVFTVPFVLFTTGVIPKKNPHNSLKLRPGPYIMKKRVIRNTSRIATEFSAE